MPATLSERELGFNEGLRAAIDYHETKANAAGKAADAARGSVDELARTCCAVLIEHRDHSNALLQLRKLTDAEAAEQQAERDALDR